MNTELRAKLEQQAKTQRVRLFLQKQETNWGLTETVEKLLSVKDLSDKELASLSSSLKWGMESGNLQEDLNSRFIEWEA